MCHPSLVGVLSALHVQHSLHLTEAEFAEMSSSFTQAKSRVRNWTEEGQELGSYPSPPSPKKVRKKGEAGGGRGWGRVRVVGKNAPRTQRRVGGAPRSHTQL